MSHRMEHLVITTSSEVNNPKRFGTKNKQTQYQYINNAILAAPPLMALVADYFLRGQHLQMKILESTFPNR